MDTIILDSVIHEWENLLDTHASMAGNSFTNWGKITPRHNEFVQKILQNHCHIICTMRTKQDYVLAEKNGRMVPEKVGPRLNIKKMKTITKKLAVMVVFLCPYYNFLPK
jgi:hypothetical protein